MIAADVTLLAPSANALPNAAGRVEVKSTSLTRGFERTAHPRGRRSRPTPSKRPSLVRPASGLESERPRMGDQEITKSGFSHRTDASAGTPALPSARRCRDSCFVLPRWVPCQSESFAAHGQARADLGRKKGRAKRRASETPNVPRQVVGRCTRNLSHSVERGFYFADSRFIVSSASRGSASPPKAETARRDADC